MPNSALTAIAPQIALAITYGAKATGVMAVSTAAPWARA